MKIYKKFVGALALGMAVTGSFSCLYASESKTSQINRELYGFTSPTSRRLVSTTVANTAGDYSAPSIGYIRTEVIDSRTCLVVHVQDDKQIGSVYIDSKSATKKNGNYSSNSGDYYIEITSGGNHTIEVRDWVGNSTREDHYVTINDNKKPTVELSQTFKNGHCYLVIDAEDNGSIASVTVNGTAISFDAKGGVENYKVTKSQTYTVVVKDVAGNTTTEKLDVDVDQDKPSLTVDKTLKNGKWYLTIKSYPSSNGRISKVTVNNSRISFNSSGGTTEYAVNSTGNYSVVVTDSYNQQVSQTVYVDTNVTSDSYKPTLSVTQKNVGGVICLAITAQPSASVSNNALSKVTVNNMTVSIPTQGGSTEYPIAASGNYVVTATDTHGNANSQTVYVTVPTANTNSSYTTPAVNTGSSSSVVFTLNKTSWVRNGVTQTMDAAPIGRSGRIYIPIRYVAYALNIDPSKVVWNANTKSAVIYDGGNVINVPLNSKTMTVNGTSQTMEAAAISYKKRIYIPISQVSKAFSGVNLAWNNSTKQATVTRR